MEVFYRYVDGSYAPPVNEWGNVCGESTPYIGLEEYPVAKRTPKGAWIFDARYRSNNGRRFILLTARKRFACPTREEAFESFIARKTREHSIYMSRAKHTEKILATAAARAEALLSMSRHSHLEFHSTDWLYALSKARSKAKVARPSPRCYP